MADIDKIGKIDQAISSVAGANRDLSKISPLSVFQRQPSVTDSLDQKDIQKVLDIQAASSALFGSSLNLGAITKAADCFKNIDDILVEKLTGKATEILLNAASGSNVVSQIQGVLQKALALSSNVKRVVDLVKQSKDASLLDLVIAAKNSGALEQVGILKEIESKYGEVVGNINEFASRIASLDICSMTNYKAGYGAVPPPAKMVQAPPPPYPSFVPASNVNYPALDAKRENDDVMFRLKDAIGDKEGVEPTAPNLSMLNELQIICRSAVNRISETDVEGHPAILDGIRAELARRRESYSSTWPPATLAEYDSRSTAMLSILQKDGKTIRAYAALKNSGQNVAGQLLASGVTIYGGPDWDWTTFLDVKPEQRPAELTAYWTSRGYTVAKGEAQLRAAGARPGTLNLSDAYTGAYGARLQPGQSCASTRVPGGSVLQLKNPDGSIYDPAGINPSGMVTVHDTGNSDLTYKKVDLFIAREHVEAYKASNMANVQVYLVSLGTKEGKNYKIAKAKYG